VLILGFDGSIGTRAIEVIRGRDAEVAGASARLERGGGGGGASPPQGAGHGVPARSHSTTLLSRAGFGCMRGDRCRREDGIRRALLSSKPDLVLNAVVEPGLGPTIVRPGPREPDLALAKRELVNRRRAGQARGGTECPILPVRIPSTRLSTTDPCRAAGGTVDAVV